jgi:hypothetical protein
MKVILCLLLLLLAGFGNQSSSLIETEKIKGIICVNGEDWNFMFRGTQFWSPTEAQVLRAEKELERFLKEKRPARSPELWTKLPRYKRQYLGIVVNGQKRIFANFYCTEERLACKPVIYEDGGDCFFQAEYDVESEKITKLEINGEA